MPKILPDRVPQPIVERRPPQMAEQLVEVPTEPVYVLVVLASKVFSRRKLLGLPGQGSTASGSRFLEQVVNNPVPQGRGGGGARGGLQDSRAHRVVCVTMQMRDFKRFFALFPVGKSVKLGPHSGSELLPESSPSTRRAHVDADGTPMVDDGGSRVLVGGTCLAVIVLCGGMLQGDVVTSL